MLLTSVEVSLRDQGELGPPYSEGLRGDPGLLSSHPSGEQRHMEAKSQTGLDRYPYVNLSHGVFENFYYTKCGISGGV